MPQFKQGGRGVFELAIVGSKFAGTGLENEQIVQIHVAWLGLGDVDPEPGTAKGFESWLTGDALELHGVNVAHIGLSDVIN